MSVPASRATRIALVLILLGAAGLRVAAIGLGHELVPYQLQADHAIRIPYLTFQIDEDHNSRIPLTLSWSNLNPHAFFLPSLLWYLLFALDQLVFQAGRLYGVFTGWGELRQLFDTGHAGPFFLLGRTLSSGLGTATVGLLYWLGRRLYSELHGLLAAGFLACAFLHVRDSALVTTDVPVTFFVVLSLLGAAGVLRDGRVRDYVLAAGAGGLATATKYNAVLVLIALVVAHGIRGVRAGHPIRRILAAPQLLGAGLVAIVVFILLNPYLFLDWAEARQDLAWAYGRFEQGTFIGPYRVGMPGWPYHLGVSLRYGLGVGLLSLALLGIARAVWRREAAGWVLLSFAGVFYGVMGGATLIFVRYMTPLLPVLCLFAATAMLSLTGWVPKRSRGWATAGLVLLAIIEPLHASTAYARVVHHIDTRVELYEYLLTLPPEGQIVTYGPSDVWRSVLPRWQPELYARNPQQTWTDVLEVVKARGARYFIVHSAALEVFSPPVPGLDAALQRSATLLREFSPYAHETAPRPVYDRADAFYFPIGRFAGVRKPGPLLRLYRLE